MGRWQNFSIWRGRLPHWRADDVTYYVTFRHRRDLTEPERALLLRELTVRGASRWNVTVACVLPGRTELLCTVNRKADGTVHELSDLVEKAKQRTANRLLKQTGERFSPFYTESYDRIPRDDAELDELWWSIVESPVSEELAEDPEEYASLYVSDASHGPARPDS